MSRKRERERGRETERVTVRKDGEGGTTVRTLRKVG